MLPVIRNHRSNTLRNTLPAQVPRHNWGMKNKLCTLRDLAGRFKQFGLSCAWLKAEARRISSAGREPLFDPEAVEESLLQRARRAGQPTSPGTPFAGGNVCFQCLDKLTKEKP